VSDRKGELTRTALFVSALAFAPLVVEAWVSRRHERAQLGRGAIVPRGDVYSVMKVIYPATFASMVLEGAARGETARVGFVAGLSVFVLAKALKWWAISSLGDCWTFRVMVVPGSERVTSGPYRFLDHPNYVGVVGELAGVALMTGAAITGPVSLAAFGWLLSKRIAVENRALEMAQPLNPMKSANCPLTK
jgi:methyltransferase